LLFPQWLGSGADRWSENAVRKDTLFAGEYEYSVGSLQKEGWIVAFGKKNNSRLTNLP
jgi:hypothetical protein